jgi:hypothetical protein
MKKTFHYKLEDLLPIGEFLLDNLSKDIDAFNRFSPVFTPEYRASIKTKISVCKELISSSTITKELKSTTHQLYDKSKNLRLKVNVLEGYLKLGADTLDIAVEDFGLKNIRNNISRNNTEGVVVNVQKSLTAVKRNQQVLEAKGMKPELITEIETQTLEINVLNVKQNNLTSDRNRLTQSNIELFNDLWDSLQPILKTAKAIYRGVDDVKLKDYTVSQLVKRINN